MLGNILGLEEPVRNRTEEALCQGAQSNGEKRHGRDILDSDADKCLMKMERI